MPGTGPDSAASITSCSWHAAVPQTKRAPLSAVAPTLPAVGTLLQETKKRIMQETTLRFPPHVTPDAIAFIKTTLAKAADMRPGATDLIHHPWVRPYLAGVVERGVFTRQQTTSASRCARPRPLGMICGSRKRCVCAAGNEVAGLPGPGQPGSGGRSRRSRRESAPSSTCL